MIITNSALYALAYFSFRLSVSSMLGDFRLKKRKYASPLQVMEAYQDALGSQQAQGSVSIMSKSGFNGMEVWYSPPFRYQSISKDTHQN